MGNNIVTLYVNEKKYVFSMGDAYGQVPQSETPVTRGLVAAVRLLKTEMLCLPACS